SSDWSKRIVTCEFEGMVTGILFCGNPSGIFVPSAFLVLARRWYFNSICGSDDGTSIHAGESIVLSFVCPVASTRASGHELSLKSFCNHLASYLFISTNSPGPAT